VNMVTNLQFHKMLGNSWVAAQLAASQEGLSSMSDWVIIRVTLADPKLEENYFHYNFVYYNCIKWKCIFAWFLLAHWPDTVSLPQIHTYTATRTTQNEHYLNAWAYGAGWLSGNACYLHWEGAQVESWAGSYPELGCQWSSSLPPSKFQDSTPIGLRPLLSNSNLLVQILCFWTLSIILSLSRANPYVLR
jgi:hypothetical protein